MQPKDPFPNPKLAPTDSAGTNTIGARFGCSRIVNGAKTMHYGVDLLAPVGTPIVAIYDGRVSDVDDRAPNDRLTEGLGKRFVVRSVVNGSPLALMYCHLSEISVENGDNVTAGQVIGKSGKSGNAFNVPNKHLHLAASNNNFATTTGIIDPEPFLKTKYGANPSPPQCS